MKSVRPITVGQDGAMLQVTPTGGPLGAIVTGIDLASAQTDDTHRELRQAWLEHLVLVFPDQPLEPTEFLAFAHTVGTPGRYPFVTGLPDHPDIIEVKKLEHEKNNFGGIWHSDTVYLEHPPMASMLVAREIPPTGGDTEFANMYLAWERLSNKMKDELSSLRAINRSDLAEVSKTRSDRLADESTTARLATQATFRAEHPVMRTHPETGRPSLYVNVAHTSQFVGRTEDDSRPILQELFEHQIRDEFVWRLKWEAGMVVLWDNRCTLHNPINDYDGHRRLLHRITLEGDLPT